MDLDRFLNLLATVFGAMGSFYTLRGIAALSPELAAGLSRTYWNFNPRQIDALAAQKADAIVGIALVLVALLIAIATLAAVPSAVRVVERRDVGVAVVAIIASAVYILLVVVGGAVHRRERLAVGRIIVSEEIEGMIKLGKLTKGEAAALGSYGSLIGFTIDDAEPRRRAFERLALALHLQVPKEFDYSEVEPATTGK